MAAQPAPRGYGRSHLPRYTRESQPTRPPLMASARSSSHSVSAGQNLIHGIAALLIEACEIATVSSEGRKQHGVRGGNAVRGDITDSLLPHGSGDHGIIAAWWDTRQPENLAARPEVKDVRSPSGDDARCRRVRACPRGHPPIAAKVSPSIEVEHFRLPMHDAGLDGSSEVPHANEREQRNRRGTPPTIGQQPRPSDSLQQHAERLEPPYEIVEQEGDDGHEIAAKVPGIGGLVHEQHCAVRKAVILQRCALPPSGKGESENQRA